MSANVEIPVRTWGLIWAIIFGSIAVFLWLVFDGAMGHVDQRYYHLEVPGSMEIPRLTTGHFYIYHEFDRSSDTKEDILPAGFQRMNFTLTPLAGGAPLKIEPVAVGPGQRPPRFVIRRTVSESMYQFDVTSPGGYRVNAEYEPGQTGGTYRVAIGQPYYIQAVRSFVLGCGLLIVAGAVVAYILFRAERQAAAAGTKLSPPYEEPNGG